MLAWSSCATLASRLGVATLSVAHLLDCSEGRLQRSVVVDIEVVGKGRERSGLVKNDLAVASEAIERHLAAQSFGNRCLAGTENHLHPAHARNVLPPAFIFAGAARESGLGSLPGRPLGGRRRRGRSRHADILGGGVHNVRAEARIDPRNLYVVHIEILPTDLTLHPLAVDQYLHAIVEIVLPRRVILGREFS